MIRRIVFTFFLCTALYLPAYALNPNETLPDAALEARARALSAHLRCLVCQNQSIDDSDAPLAQDLRLVVRQRLLAGDTDAEIREFIVARYGEFVLLKPQVSAKNAPLWAAPFIFLLIGLALIWHMHRKNSGD